MEITIYRRHWAGCKRKVCQIGRQPNTPSKEELPIVDEVNEMDRRRFRYRLDSENADRHLRRSRTGTAWM